MMNKKQCVSHIFILFFLILYQTISMLIFGYYVCNSMSHTHTRTCVGRLMSISLCQNFSPTPEPQSLHHFSFCVCCVCLEDGRATSLSSAHVLISIASERASKRLFLDHTMSLHTSMHR